MQQSAARIWRSARAPEGRQTEIYRAIGTLKIDFSFSWCETDAII
jgi:hypothetical protein